MQDKISEFSILKLAKFIIAFAAFFHLIFSNLHVNGLLLLENQICGFLMFVSVIFGLVCFFQATRTKFNNASEFIPMVIFLVITVGALIMLGGIYSDALANQKSLKNPLPVKQAMTLTYAMAVVYVVSFVILLVDYFKSGLKFNGEKSQDE